MKNILFEIEETSGDLSYKLIYIVGRKLRGRGGDKTYPKVTQCLLLKNNLIVSFAEVVKCDDDKDNMEYALKLVTTKVIKNVYFTQMRKELWLKLFSSIKQYK